MDYPDFDDWTEVYEALVDWPKRLAFESGFYQQLFADCRARRLLDAACGTGHHAARFHSWGLEVVGADVSPAMIHRAERLHGSPAGLSWTVRSFEEPIGDAQGFDVVVCAGNSLALAADLDAAERALCVMLAGLRDGGRLVVHVLNVQRLPDGPCVWQKCLRTGLAGQDCLIIKGVHCCGERGYVNLLVVPQEGEPVLQHKSVPFLGLSADELERMARLGGARAAAFYGGYHSEPFDPATSVDLLMLAEK